MSLRSRIAAAGAVAVAVTVLLAAVIIYLGVRAELRGEVDTALGNVADAVEVRFEAPAPEPGRPPLDRDLLRRRQEPYGGATGYVQLVTNTGQALPPPGVLRARVPLDSDARAIAGRGAGEDLADMTVGGTHLRVLTRGVAGGGAIQVARPLSEVDDQLGGILLVLALVSAGGVALAAGLGVLLARTALAPIGRFTSRTEAVAADPDVSQRMEVGSGDDELSRLARSFNATLDELERSVESQRQLVADASHELRTPIASLRANIQTLEEADRLPPGELAALRADIVEELDELTALVADVVELARGAKPSESLDDVRLDEVVGAAVERARARGRRARRDPRRARARRGGGRSRAHPAGRVQPARQRDQVEPAGRPRGGGARGRRAHRSRPRGGLRAGGPRACVRALLPRGQGTREARLGARPGDREAGGGGSRRQRGGGERAGGRGTAPALVRAVRVGRARAS